MSALARAMWAPVRHATQLGPHVLPACMCGVLRRAVEDAMAVEKMEGYKLNMGVWHYPNGVCKVCMAGAVMVKTLNVDRGHECDPGNFSEGTASKLYAVNGLRTGMVGSAFSYIYGNAAKRTVPQDAAMQRASDLIKDNFVKHRHRGYAEWEVYLQAADVLEAVGL